MLLVEDVTKAFGDFTAVRGTNLQIARGELVAVIGPNGAGKTTLFNVICGQLKPDSGRIVFKEEEIGGLPPYRICRRGVARSFQIANIFPRLSVFRNVQESVLAQQRKSSVLFRPARKIAVEQTREILEDVGLVAKAQRVAGSLSHGDQRILEIAIALGNQPELIILDEPTAGMSPDETAATMTLIRRLAEDRGLTILFCEHDMDVVFGIASSIMVMRQGETLIQGTPETVRANAEVQKAYLGDTA